MVDPAHVTAAAVVTTEPPAHQGGAELDGLDKLIQYVGRIREFDRTDWIVYLVWIGMMLGLVGTTGGFLMLGRAHGVTWPPEAWLVPGGGIVFALSIAVDTIGHRTIYKQALKGGEALVHHITIFNGIGCVVLLCAAYRRPIFAIPAIVLTALSFIYSFVDEAFHWRRYVHGKSDVVEMWSHVGILVGHGIMMLGWWSCYQQGYPGVREALAALA